MDFKEILNLYAKYNKYANSEMVRILKALPEPRLQEAAGTYYKTMAGLLNHGLQTTAGSLKRCADRGFLPDLILPVIGSFPQASWGEGLFATFSEFETLRAKADDTLVAACAAATVEDLDKTFSFMGRDNQQKTLSYGGNLLALYAHEIHHRGGVSTILDGWGIENDWSSLMRFLFL
ncbi:MAG: DinB family protein [Rectinemataceae bacterium]|jgi:uncharacterized damage-inducible protein DinB